MDFIIFIVNLAFSILYILLALRAVLPWLPHNRTNPVFSPIYAITDPILTIVKQGLPPSRIGMDVSAFIVIILLWIIHQIILKILS